MFPCVYCSLRTCIQAVIPKYLLPPKSFPALRHSNMSLCPLLVSFRLCLHVQTQNLLCLSIPRAWHQKYLTWAMLTEHDHPFFCICSNRLIAGGLLSMCRCKREREIFPVLPHQSVVVCFHLSQSHLVTLPRHLE